ncbi:disabled homolog 1-like isoform X1 [Saccostrea echinata]|uniref:disabled homolog 1-like isoform X1 n=2 Tax=Saccostrea echinata TaxID=191078 RepID=UPI002A81F65E|nr:disabled homolog 1-like isoform X1 [Saccostrea echinata]
MSEETTSTPETSVSEPTATTTTTPPADSTPQQRRAVKKPPVDPRNDPFRFKGEGVVYNAKLIGVSDVADARGDRMCQETILAQKMAVKAAGQHKQRIIINISEEGIKLIDLRTATLLHHHPVHKISFISRDVSDRRAFGYIYGTEDRTHKFFGIKTEKAAENVVLTLRDLFQVVYENKKKEMEVAKQQQTDDKPKEEAPKNVVQLGGDLTTESSTDDEPDSKVPPNNAPVEKEPTDLSALQTELVSIAQGIKQIDKMESLFDDIQTPPAPAATSSDPWGTSAAPAEQTNQSKSASSDLDELNLFSSEPAPAKKKDDIMSLFGPSAQGFGSPQPGFGGPQQGFGGPQQGFGGPQQGFGAPQQGFGGNQQQQGFGAFGQPATPFPPTSQANPFAAQQGGGFGGLAPPPVPQRQQQPMSSPWGGQQQPHVSQQQNFSLFDEPVLAPTKVEDPFAAPVTTASQPKDAFADLCSIGSTTTNKTPKDLFAERNAPPKKSINEMMQKPTPNPQQASDPFGNVEDSSLPAAEFSPFTSKLSDPFDTSFLKSSPALHIQTTSASNVSAFSKSTEELTLNQNYFDNSDDFDLPSPQGPPPPLPNDPPPPAPPPRPISSHTGNQLPSLPVPPPRNSENVPKTVSLSSNSQIMNGNTPVPRPRPRSHVASSMPTPLPRNNASSQEAPPKEQSTKDSHSDSFSSFTIEDPFTTNDPFADTDPFNSDGFGSSAFDILNCSDPFASFSSPVKHNLTTKNGDFVSDARNDPFSAFDSSFGDSFNCKSGSLKKKSHRKSSGGKNMPVSDPNDPFGLLVASKPVQNGSEPVYATVNKIK